MKTKLTTRQGVLLLAGLLSMALLIISGVMLLTIESEYSASGSGETIMESSYHAIGVGMIGLGVFAGAILISMAVKKE